MWKIVCITEDMGKFSFVMSNSKLSHEIEAPAHWGSYDEAHEAAKFALAHVEKTGKFPNLCDPNFNRRAAA